MKNQLSVIKGIHPGFILGRELKRLRLSKGPFAISLQEYPQTLGAITKGKRDMNTALALKIEKALGFDEGYLMILQTWYDIEKEKRKQNTGHPDYARLRPILFWDTNMKNIDWQKQWRAVINRVFERGNETEKKEITRFYGKAVINKCINAR